MKYDKLSPCSKCSHLLSDPTENQKGLCTSRFFCGSLVSLRMLAQLAHAAASSTGNHNLIPSSVVKIINLIGTDSLVLMVWLPCRLGLRAERSFHFRPLPFIRESSKKQPSALLCDTFCHILIPLSSRFINISRLIKTVHHKLSRMLWTSPQLDTLLAVDVA